MTNGSASLLLTLQSTRGERGARKTKSRVSETVNIFQTIDIDKLMRATVRKNGAKLAENRGDLTHKLAKM